MALLWVRGDPHLVVVATFQHDHGDGAGVILASWGSCACHLRPWWVSLHQVADVAPPVGGCPAFPFREPFLRWDAEGVGSRSWGGPLAAPGAWRGPGIRWWRYERVCPAQVRDPYASMVRLVDVEPPDPRVNKVVRNLHLRADERLELPHRDVCGCGVRREDRGEEPVWVDVLEVFPEGCHQPARGCVGVDVVDCPQFRFLKEVRVPQLWLSGGWGGHGLPVLVRCGASRGGVPWGGAKLSLRYVPHGGLMLRGHRTERGGGRGATGPLRARSSCHFFVRSRVVWVVFPLLWCVLRALAVWLHRSRGGEPRGAWAQLLGWPVPMSQAGAFTPCLRGGALRGSLPTPVRVAGRPRVPLAVCPRESVPPVAGRPPTLGGRRRTSWTHRVLPGGGLCGAPPVALARPALEWWGCAPARCGASLTGASDLPE